MSATTTTAPLLTSADQLFSADPFQLGTLVDPCRIVFDYSSFDKDKSSRTLRVTAPADMTAVLTVFDENNSKLNNITRRNDGYENNVAIKVGTYTCIIDSDGDTVDWNTIGRGTHCVLVVKPTPYKMSGNAGVSLRVVAMKVIDFEQPTMSYTYQ